MNTSKLTFPDRDIRQRGLVPPEMLACVHAVMIGVGAIGRQVALQLAAMGVPAMELFDHDQVGEENLAVQGYWPADIGREKVLATGELCRQINPELEVGVHPEPFRRSTAGRLWNDIDPATRLAIFCCVDSISTRRLIWDAVRSRAAFFADGRMNAEVLRVLASADPAGDDHYATTLFTPTEAYAGPCTARSTIYTASIAAGLMLTQFTRWLRGGPVDRDVSVNLLAMEVGVG